jgi:hypothetical protein
MSNNDSQPAFRVYSVIPREGKDDYWLNIGLAFPHQDGKGFNVMLQAFPINPKLVLREASGDDEQSADRQDANGRRESARDQKPQASAGRFGGRR